MTQSINWPLKRHLLNLISFSRYRGTILKSKVIIPAGSGSLLFRYAEFPFQVINELMGTLIGIWLKLLLRKGQLRWFGMLWLRGLELFNDVIQ